VALVGVVFRREAEELERRMLGSLVAAEMSQTVKPIKRWL
jgi:hypothetical protein